jgi:hypothetical protein
MYDQRAVTGQGTELYLFDKIEPEKAVIVLFKYCLHFQTMQRRKALTCL